VAKTRDIRRRILSVRNIHKITRTMEKVAQSKGMKLTSRYEEARAFRRGIASLLPEALGVPLAGITAAQELAAHPLGALRAREARALFFCVTSSRGLCGGYNARVIQAARAQVDAARAAGKEPVLAVMGRKGLAYFRYHGVAVDFSVAEADENIPFAKVQEIAAELCARFAARQVDSVRIVSTRWKSRAAQDVRTEALLPLVPGMAAAALAPLPAVPAEGPGGEPVYLVEPDRGRVLDSLAPLLVQGELFCAVLEAMLCEQAQRSAAMRNASDNADSMTKRLTRTYNRARQAQITNDMIEIISGSEGGRT
jgi:F-type H+-transporting ATPase subunit gamma